MNKFRTGDTVLCVEPKGYLPDWDLPGGTYLVESCTDAGVRLVGRDRGYSPDRFELCPPAESEQRLGTKRDDNKPIPGEHVSPADPVIPVPAIAPNWTPGVGKKNDKGLPPVQQGCLNYFPRAIRAVALVSKFGAEKYSVPFSDQNWRTVDDAFNRYEDALARHTTGKAIDGPYDPESKLLHIAHRAWDSLATLELYLSEGNSLEDKS